MRRSTSLVVMLLVVLSLVLTQCALPGQPGGAKKHKVAAIFPGVITDADYNTLGYLALEAVNKDLGLEIGYSEKVAVPDVERVMREYVDQGYTIIWTHGGQFFSQTAKMAQEYPDVSFVAEFDAPAENPPANLWVMDRNLHQPFFLLGVIAARVTQTGKVGYIGGLTLPFSYAEVHAAEQGIQYTGRNVELKPVWVGDFNDPTKARELADAMIADGVDVIMGSLNLGMLGVFEAVKAAPHKVYVMAKYSDKSDFAPDNYITSAMYDYTKPFKDIVQNILDGKPGGYYPMSFETGHTVLLPLRNVPPEVEQEVKKLLDDLKAGKMEVVKDTTPIK